MKLRSRIEKSLGRGVNRELSPEQTWERVAPHIRRAGITRTADITGLDYVGLPVYSAIVPRSNDSISVYSGKGFSRIDARVSAVMEAIERYSAWLPMRPDLVASYDELAAAGTAVMHPGEYNLQLSRGYRDDGPISWLLAWDLLNEEEVLVPQDGAVYQARLHEQPCYQVATTNGLASGNSLEEAICHALCEVVERDSMTLAELIGNHLPRTLVENDCLGPFSDRVVDDLRGRHPHVRMDEVPPRVASLLEKFGAAGVDVQVLDITSDLGIASFLAVTNEDIGDDASRGHCGYGTHLDAEAAVIRALTECAQARAVDVQAMREDISLPGADVPGFEAHVRRSSTVDASSWAWKPASRTVRLSEVPSHPGDDIAADIHRILDQLRSAGAGRVLVVDLSPPQIPVSVVRVIVPFLESWATDHCKIGPRASAAWSRAARSLVSGGPTTDQPVQSR